MSVDLGSIYSDIELRLDKFEAGITSAIQGLYKLQIGTSEAASLMDKSIFTAVENISKEMRIWELSNESTQSSMSKLENKASGLKSQIGLLETEIKKSNATMADIENQFGKNSREADAYKSHLLDLKVKQAELTAEWTKSNYKATTLSGRVKLLGEEYDKNREKLSLLTKTGDSLKGVGSNLTLGLTTPIVGLGIAAESTAMNFEAQMSKVQAISGATGEDFKMLNTQAIQLGADTVFSASAAAQGMENLASAGFNVNEIYSAMPGMLSLAASGDIEIADAADIASSALRGFGLAATQSGHVADVLAKAAADTNADVTGMGYALKYAAAPAHALGLSLEETAAAVGVMSNAGIKGEQAGTTLRGALTRLVNPSEDAAKKMQQLGFTAFDSQGKMKSLATVIGELQDKTKGLTDQQKQQAIAEIFGQEAMSGMLVLLGQGKDKLNDLTKSFINSDGAAEDMASTMQNNVKGSIEQMKGSVETAGIKLGTVLAPTIKEIADDVTNLANKFSELIPETQATIVKTLAFTAAAGPAIWATGALVGSLGNIISAGKAVTSVFATTTLATEVVGVASATATPGVAGLGTAIAGASVPLLPWIAGITAAGVAAFALYKYLSSDCVPAIDLFGDHIKSAANDAGYFGTKAGVVAKDVDQDISKVSDSTKKAITAYMDLDKKAGTSLLSLKANNARITSDISDDMKKNIVEESKKIAQDLKKNTDAMATQIISGLNKRAHEAESTLSEFFKNAKGISTKEQSDILKKTQDGYKNQEKTAQDAKDKINAIYKKAADEHRALTNDELNDIQKLQEQMKKQAIDTLTQSQLEQQAIYEGIKNSATTITTEQASEVIKNSATQRDKTISAANEQAKKVEAEIIYQRDVTKTLSADQADKMIAEAERQKQDTIKKAQEQHKAVVDEVGAQCTDTSKKIDEKSGEIKTSWQVLMDWFDTHVIHPKIQVDSNLKDNADGKYTTKNGEGYASGTESATRGWHMVGEEGPEIVWFNGGESVSNAYDTKSMFSRVSSSSAFGYGQDFTQGYAEGINSNVGLIKGAASNVANSIYKLLHFSVPDEGPLSDADTYGTDFMQLITDTIEQNSNKPAEATKKVAQLVNDKVQELKDKLKSDLKSLNDELANLNKAEEVALRGLKGAQRYAVKDEYDAKEQAIKDQIKLRKDQADKEIAEIKRIGKATKEELKEEIQAHKEFVEKVNNLQDSLKDALKQKYKEEEEAQEAALNQEMENLDRWKEESEQRINSVYDTKIKAIESASNAQIEALEAESNALDKQLENQEREDKNQEELSKIDSLKAAIKYEHNDFNKAELQKQLELTIKERNKRLAEQSIQDKKSELQQQMTDIKKDADSKKNLLEEQRQNEIKNLNNIYNSEKNILKQRLQSVKNFYEEKLKDANIEAEAEKLIMDNNQKAIIDLLHAYEPQYEIAGKSLGERLAAGFQPQFDRINAMIDSLAAKLAAVAANAEGASSSVPAATNSVNWYAEGAIFDRPSIIGVGEAGTEAVIPLDKLSGIIHDALQGLIGGGATVNNININSPIAKTPAVERRAYEAIMRRLAFDKR